MNEFEIIQQYFAALKLSRDDTLVSIGDDAAIISVENAHQLAITTDTMVEGIHFPINTDPFDLGHKILAVNLSDLAAMGATPAWVTLALTLPHANQSFLQKFSEGFYALAKQFNIGLIGGDLTHGPLSMTIQAIGYVDMQHALLRSRAAIGDKIYVTGTLGDAGFALACLNENIKYDTNYFLNRLNRPTPRVEEGLHLKKFAHAAIDISDGFVSDLTHILNASNVGAKIFVDQLPLSEELLSHCTPSEAIHYALTSGDDYELCFTMPQKFESQLDSIFAKLNCRMTAVGEIIAGDQLNLQYKRGEQYNGKIFGYKHF